MTTFRLILLSLAVLLLGLAVVLPIKPGGKTALGIAACIGAGVDLLLKLNDT